MQRFFGLGLVGLAFLANSQACARGEELDATAFGNAGSNVTAGTTTGMAGTFDTSGTGGAGPGTGGSSSTATSATSTTSSSSATTAGTGGGSTSSGGGSGGSSTGSGGATAGTGGFGGSSSGAGGSATGGRGGSGGLSGTGGSGGSGAGGSGMAGAGGGSGSCSPTLTNISLGKCNATAIYNAKLYKCISQAVGVNGEPTGCGTTGVYCSQITPTDAAWGTTAWQYVQDCP